MPLSNNRECVRCPKCHGSGHVILYFSSLKSEEKCYLCNQTGKISRKKRDDYYYKDDHDPIEPW